jgi:hypothetical protein
MLMGLPESVLGAHGAAGEATSDGQLRSHDRLPSQAKRAGRSSRDEALKRSI